MKNVGKLFLSASCAAIILASCGGDSDSNTSSSSFKVDLGEDKSLYEGTSVKIDGKVSNPSGEMLNYSWEQISGPEVLSKTIVTNSDSAIPTTLSFILNSVTSDSSIKFRLTAINKNKKSASDEITVKIKNVNLAKYSHPECFQYYWNLPDKYGGSQYIAISEPELFSQVTRLSCSGKYWSKQDLIDLRDIPNLKDVFLNNSTFEDVNLIGYFKNLNMLSLSNSKINNIDFVSDMQNLTSINLSTNTIEDITPLTSLTNLTTIILGNNQISDISLLKNRLYLTQLDISNNPINSYDAIFGKTIDTLKISQGKLTDSSPLLSKPPKSRILDLSHNSISNINTFSTRELEELNLSYNNISDISSFNAPNLNTLNLDSNKVSQISNLANMQKLQNISLNNNLVDSLALSQANSSLYKNLYNFSLAGNKITDITSLAAISKGYDATSYSTYSIKKLPSLNISNNNIANLLPLYGVYLSELNIENNTIYDISPISGNSSYWCKEGLPLGSAGLVSCNFKLNVTQNCISDFSSLSNSVELTGKDQQKNCPKIIQ